MSSAVQLPRRGSEARCNQCKMKFEGRTGVSKHGMSTGHIWEPPIRCLACGEGFSKHKTYKFHLPSCPASQIATPSTTVTVSSGVSGQSATSAPGTPKTQNPPPVATASLAWPNTGIEGKKAKVICSCAMCARGSNSTGTGDQAAPTNTDGTLASSVASDRTVPPGNMVPFQVNGATPDVAHSVHSNRSPEGSLGHGSSIGSFEEIESRTAQLSVSDPEFIETSNTGSTNKGEREDGGPPVDHNHTAEPQVAFASQAPAPAATQGTCTQEIKPLSWHCRSCLRDACVKPVATACGHIFCLQCIIRELEVNSACPACKKVFLIKLDVAL
ncbi:hypothetical protein NUW54_g76 [Trametes sanguinea]|uniref:Uncharacterized protein n=2 Tax=Trametes sanguinea TaxID=158606 RepID=A0ACC1QCY4_9APHY|nr:hypothetical protein NUW54_g2944 [Trametes sanguinea]KAJ3019457.1 hypothetical protein NUW54_g76 [Trametes sanguinea]